MAVVVRQSFKTGDQTSSSTAFNPVEEVKIDTDGGKPVEKSALERSLKSKRSLQKWKSFPNNCDNSSRSKKWTKGLDSHSAIRWQSTSQTSR
ncbi:hypothetical protein K2173_018729 [Erythroxylum novogranatense]|uniref:Uncharacterized protein n=1 Tax=Erythroxylum novogranatense TaxID=1862640 RepID=A0AAV8SB89_9ROSI|nr:hypothetical protein K2173_018729 [Erythroxylum novogranatense]